MAESIRKVLFSRIRLAMAGVTTRNSKAATRPARSVRDRSTWLRMQIRETDNCTRTCACWFTGNASMTRLIVPAAPVVCSVAKTRWPVSAARIADSIVSRSRISPTSITSGSARRPRRNASEKLGTSTPTSRWAMIDFL